MYGARVPERPRPVPVGLQVNQVARKVGQAFDDALQAAGGSLPVWLVLLNLSIRQPPNQRELAVMVGIREATLTHHLNAMETANLLTRRRDPLNRRVHVVELTDAGRAAFLTMRAAAIAFDERLTDGFRASELQVLGGLLDRLAANVRADVRAPDDADTRTTV